MTTETPEVEVTEAQAPEIPLTYKTVFLFDKDGIFYGRYEAQESPEERGTFIEPTDSTPVEPPNLELHQAAVFSTAAGTWSVVPDFRGVTFYDQTTGASVVIEVVGTPPSNLGAEPPPKTTEQLRTEALAKRDGLLTLAAMRIAPLQDAVDIGESTPAEDASLLLWKRYRIDLNRVHLQAGFPQTINWPVAPT